MKKIFALFLSLAIVSQSVVTTAIVVYYHLNKTYITRQLCENRDSPKLHCNGHCYLSKQLKKAEEGESKTTQFIKEKEEIVSRELKVLPGEYFPYFKISAIPFQDFIFCSTDNTLPLFKPPIA